MYLLNFINYRKKSRSEVFFNEDYYITFLLYFKKFYALSFAKILNLIHSFITHKAFHYLPYI